MFVCLLHILLTTANLFSEIYSQIQIEEKKFSTSSKPTSEVLLLISTIDGQLKAISPKSGVIKWTLQEDAVVKVPVTVKSGFTFLPDPQDGTLYLLREGRLKKLPFTIPQLVHMSPSKSSDGVLYAGKKMDSWFALDPHTGHKMETLSSETTDKVCPISTEHALFIGRTEYSVTMFDSRSSERRWNVTFADYSANVLPEDNHYELQHYTSSSDGRLVTVDSLTGDILWSNNFGLPIVAMYVLESDGMHKLPFTVVGKETLDNLLMVENTGDDGSHAKMNRFVRQFLFMSQKKTLYPTLYIGEYEHGFYALPSLVDEKTATIVAKYMGLPLLEGPKPLDVPNEAPLTVPERSQITVDVEMAKFTEKTTTNGELLLLGYHELPEEVFVKLTPDPPMRIPPVQAWLPHISGSSFLGLPDAQNHSSTLDYNSESVPSTDWSLAFLVLIGILVFLLTVCLLFIFKRMEHGVASADHRSAQTSRSRGWWPALLGNDVPSGYYSVGKILINPSVVLGRGCEGTIVFKGQFDGRDVAVKRIVSDFYTLADREVCLLRESDTHPNVIRYFCMEADSQFRYIALEYCAATLFDFVEDEKTKLWCPLMPQNLLRQAMEGLCHLHSLKIVHRDIKPANVLLTVPDSKGIVRAVISDFGLCKKLTIGRNSLSKTSGFAGTDGWIAPEMIENDRNNNIRITCAVDIFSFGCIFYYVLTNGSHPFGDSLRRQANIMSGEYSFKEIISEDNGLICDLVESMLNRDPSLRPTSEAVLKHPYFWTKAQQLAFFQDVSDRVEKEDAESPVLKCLEKEGWIVVKKDWRQHICPALQTDLKKFRSYRGNSVRDLLRALRNKKHHYRELPDDVRSSLGHIPDEFVTYFTSRFPKLLLHVYKAMKLCRSETPFSPYYASQDFDVCC